jgi:hypothetical protein
MIWDIDSLRAKWLERGVDPQAAITYGPGEDAEAGAARHHH